MYPLSPSARDELLLTGQKPGKLYHNCVGKHLGLLALCRHKGYPLDGYVLPEHPAQREAAEAIACLAGRPAGLPAPAVDGCGFPVYALPLRELALMFMKLACPDLIERTDIRLASARAGQLMNDHPEMVAAPWFICSTLLRDPNLAAKGGAKGVYAFGLRKERLAFALKVLDGAEEAWPFIIAAVLESIGYANRDTIKALHELGPSAMLNDAGERVGETKAVFEWERLS